MASKRLLCVPNFSEGRNQETLDALIAAAKGANVKVVEASWDADHHRMVLAFEGGPGQCFNALLATAGVAVERIDLTKHRGAHPRIGALDVAPIVPLREVSLEEAVRFSHRVGRAIAGRFGVPVYFYEKSATPGRIGALPELRKGGFEAWAGKPLAGERKPDAGPAQFHPTAGAVALGVREALIAFNINLADGNMAAARAAAKRLRALRESDPDLAGVRAIAVMLESRGLAQVSMNITQPDQVNLFEVYRRAVNLIEEEGASALESELIGVLRFDDLCKAFAAAINASIKPGQIVGLP